MFKKIKNPWVRGVLIGVSILVLVCCLACAALFFSTEFVVSAYPYCTNTNEMGRMYDPALSAQTETCMYEGDMTLDGEYKFLDVDNQQVAVVDITIYGAESCWLGTPEDEALLQTFNASEDLVIPLQDDRMAFDLSCRNGIEGDEPAHFWFELPSIDEIVPDTIWQYNA